MGKWEHNGQSMVTIRMKRGGRKNAPVYTIVAADRRCPRDGRFLEKLGQYLPGREKGAELRDVKEEAIRSWAHKGAALSDSVRTLLKRNKIQL